MNLGYQLACSMWVLTALCLALVILRLYTRICVVKFVGAEDHLYAWTFLLLLFYTIFLQVAVQYGFGQSLWTLPLDDTSDAIFWSYVANTFAITGNAMAKLSMGLFLLRVVQVRWHKIALWVLVFITASTSFALVVMLWNQTKPVKASWDPLRTPGVWVIQIQPMSVMLGVWSSICDFFFAGFPWLVIWSLNMPRREKIMLASGMSLGVIAGACGIVRTVVLSRLDIMNYTLNFVPFFAWSGAEIAVSMVCLGIPTLRPLYLKHRGIHTEYGRQGHSRGSVLPQFTMIDRKASPPASLHDAESTHTVSITYEPIAYAHVRPATAHAPPKPALRSSSDVARPATAHTHTSRPTDDTVDEIVNMYGSGSRAIWVKKEVQVQRDNRAWPLAD
ncbi:hypothetical protein GQ53DRAFT_709630 [Thozetella sp. PMI_491]|nr:hypothetical protein GQ53DRAFT_709630 [Thozetella sp. PMI_491]